MVYVGASRAQLEWSRRLRAVLAELPGRALDVAEARLGGVVNAG